MALNAKYLVFIVDDDEDACVLLTHAFAEVRPDCKVECFYNGQALLSRLEQREYRTPDLIILDLVMPQIDGLSILRQIKMTEVIRLIPVLIFTQAGSPSNILQSYQSGSNSFATKPGNYQELKEYVAIICQYWFETSHRPSQLNIFNY